MRMILECLGNPLQTVALFIIAIILYCSNIACHKKHCMYGYNTLLCHDMISKLLQCPIHGLSKQFNSRHIVYYAALNGNVWNVVVEQCLIKSLLLMKLLLSVRHFFLLHYFRSSWACMNLRTNTLFVHTHVLSDNSLVSSWNPIKFAAIIFLCMFYL